MFNRYWRDYPWFLQLVLFGLMAFTMVSFAALLLHLTIPGITGSTLGKILDLKIDSSKEQITAFLWVQAIYSVFAFAVSPLLFAYQSHPDVAGYLGLPKQSVHILLSIVIMVSAMPLLIELANVLKLLPLGSANDAAQNKIEEATKAILKLQTTGELARAVFIMALLPAIGEELFFRGVLLRLAHQKMNNMVWPIIITSLLFALVHGTPYNLLSIMLAGVLLCLIYNWTGSLWCGIAAHFCYNGSQVYMSYLAKDNEVLKQATDNNHLPIQITIVATLVFVIALVALWITRKPLPLDWSANFTTSESEQTNSM